MGQRHTNIRLSTLRQPAVLRAGPNLADGGLFYAECCDCAVCTLHRGLLSLVFRSLSDVAAPCLVLRSRVALQSICPQLRPTAADRRLERIGPDLAHSDRLRALAA